ncbi:MAG TPA: type II secretion system F family protein [Bauldia sp.]|nr:type II secretion system F family protein [Bauldia sp.]
MLNSPIIILLAISGLAMFSAGGLAYALLFRRIESENKVGRRIDQIAARGSAGEVQTPRTDAAKRRKSVQETLAEIEAQQKAKAKQNKAPPILLRIQQAGLSWTRRTFIIFSVIIGVITAALVWVMGAPIYAVGAFAVVGVLGLPRWIIDFLRRRRMKKFLEEFANAMDVIVRGVKAGLPLHECVRIIANEAAEPVKSEFRQITEAQTLGITLADAVARLPDRVPVPETSFFAIVVTIQQKAGGNLSETLGNLSRVLRERRKMVGKIKAMSMEAKASAWIIGSLPIVVMGLVYLTSPAYISLLFTDPTGNVILAASGCWMAIGVFIMRRMINFDF